MAVIHINVEQVSKAVITSYSVIRIRVEPHAYVYISSEAIILAAKNVKEHKLTKLLTGE